MTKELNKLREALRRVQYQAASLADAQVIALEALTQRPAAQGVEREAFEAWFDDYYNKACAEFGGIDCTDPKGIAEDAWQARASLPTQPAAQATPEPSRGMIGTGAHALANELAQAVAQDDADPDGHDMSAGLFGPNVSAWLRKISADYLPQPAPPEPVGEPVAEVVWYDPQLDHFPRKDGHKIIDASMAFMDAAPLGTKLYADRPATGVPDVEAAAKKLAECMGYPWEHMPSAGRVNMRKHAEAVLAAAQAKGGGHG